MQFLLSNYRKEKPSNVCFMKEHRRRSHTTDTAQHTQQVVRRLVVEIFYQRVKVYVEVKAHYMAVIKCADHIKDCPLLKKNLLFYVRLICLSNVQLYALNRRTRSASVQDIKSLFTVIVPLDQLFYRKILISKLLRAIYFKSQEAFY